MESRFRYQVTPYSPIKDLIPGQSLRRPFTSDLTKDEVLLCMKHGPVARLFPGKLPIKVTGSNLNNLHKKDFESDFVDVTSKYTEDAKKVEIEQPGVAEEPKTEVPTEQNLSENTESKEFKTENVKSEESVAEEPNVVEEQLSDSTPSEDTSAQLDDSSVEGVAEGSEEDTDVEEDDTEVDDEEGETLSVEDADSTPVGVNYQQNKKKKKRH